MAADFMMLNTSPKVVYSFLDLRFPNSAGIGLYENRVHFDVRDQKSRWDNSNG